MKTNKGLVEFVKGLLNMNTIYVLGAFGQEFTQSFLDQKCAQLEWNEQQRSFLSQYVNKSQKAYDCSGMIKAYLWDNKPSNYVAAEDENNDHMLDRASVKGPISTMPEVPGILVFMPGHVGVYIGNGQVIECTPNIPLGGWGVIQTSLKGRGWTHWAEYSRISYGDKESEKPSTETPSGGRVIDQILDIGDTCVFDGEFITEDYNIEKNWIYNSEIGGWFSAEICTEVGSGADQILDKGDKFIIEGKFTVDDYDLANDLVHLSELDFWVNASALTEV